MPHRDAHLGLMYSACFLGCPGERIVGASSSSRGQCQPCAAGRYMQAAQHRRTTCAVQPTCQNELQLVGASLYAVFGTQNYNHANHSNHIYVVFCRAGVPGGGDNGMNLLDLLDRMLNKSHSQTCLSEGLKVVLQCSRRAPHTMSPANLIKPLFMYGRNKRSI